MNRGEVWWARLPAPAGRRPVVLVSRNSTYALRAAFTVVEVSTLVRGILSEVPLGPRDGLSRPCVANADNLLTIPKVWLDERIAVLSAPKVAALDAAIRYALGMGG